MPGYFEIKVSGSFDEALLELVDRPEITVPGMEVPTLFRVRDGLA